jgi:DNA gyrase subunit B
MSDDPVRGVAYGDGENIVPLKSYEHVRKRPGMYIGDTGGSGLHHMAYEIIHNALDEVHRGHGTRVVVEILRSGGLRVRDEGRGIPVDPMPTGDKHILEILCTVSGQGRTAHSWPANGLHGIGLIATNALSRRFVVEVRRDGFRRRQTFSRGEATSPLEMLGPTTKTGTTITFWPDPQILSCLDFCFIRLRQRLEEFAMLLPRLQVRLVDHRVDPPLVAVIHWPNGLSDGLEQFGRGRRPLHPTAIHGSAQDGDTHVSIAFRWQHDDTPRIWSLCNGGTTHGDGTHVSGFYRGLTRSLHRYLWRIRLVPAGQPRSPGRRSPTGEYLRAGIVAIISVESRDPHYALSTKDRVFNEEFDALTAALTDRLLTAFIAEHPDEARTIARHLQSPPTIDPKTGF